VRDRDNRCLTDNQSPKTVDEVPTSVRPIGGASSSTAGFIGILPRSSVLAAVETPVLVTRWAQFIDGFGDLAAADESHKHLAHAIYGFFNNGGSRCYVARVHTAADAANVLKAFAATGEVAIVAAPGNTNDDVRAALITHCAATGCFAILDGPSSVASAADMTIPVRSDMAAFYFPWIIVADSAPAGSGTIAVPPSGHIAGVYARVDTQRGVHKAPANEVILGALGVTQAVSKNDQGDLNKNGVNCIRVLNGNILVWGARTVGGDANADLKYINVRRTLLFLRKSIEEGTQWVVFEPNTLGLWQKISRNVTAFLTNVWRSGALFGATPQEAFYVKCDAETNPPELRDVGQVVTEIGVAIVRPAEFVIFRISQYTAPPK
jgi:phage tail sheath protein FI